MATHSLVRFLLCVLHCSSFNKSQVPYKRFSHCFSMFLNVFSTLFPAPMLPLTTWGQSHNTASIVYTWDQLMAQRHSALTAWEKPPIPMWIRGQCHGWGGGAKVMMKRRFKPCSPAVIVGNMRFASDLLYVHWSCTGKISLLWQINFPLGINKVIFIYLYNGKQWNLRRTSAIWILLYPVTTV